MAKQPLISVCTGTYEMHGMGPQFLRESFEILAKQTFKDFDVIISDYSLDESIKKVVDEYQGILDIKYFKNTNHDVSSKMSCNTNNAIQHADGKIIKILFLDDFLYDEKSLEHVAKNFDIEKDRWLVTGCTHTSDKKTYFRNLIPRWNHKIHLGNNTISSPSVMAIRNDRPLLFDMRMKWFMDVEYYKRMYDKFGPPKIVAEICAVNRVGAHQTTNTEIDYRIDEKEFKYVVDEFYSPLVAYVLYLKRILRNRTRIIRKKLVPYLKPPISAVKNGWRTMRWLFTEYKAKMRWLPKERILDYRKKIKVYDVCIFFDELDLLEIRLNILDPYVDFFVIVEATETFSGLPKPLHYSANKSRFKKWEKKIIYFVINDTPIDEADARKRLTDKNLSELDRQILHDTLTSDNVGKAEIHWFKEFYQKETIKKAIEHLSDSDFCFISDLDEVWNPNILMDYSKDDVYKLRQIGYMYFLNNRTNEIDWDSWSGTIATKFKNIRHACLNHLRTHKKMDKKYVFLRNGGWHFAFQGGYEGAMKKLKDREHFWYKPEETIPNIKERVEKNIHYRGNRSIKIWTDNRGLPDYIIHNTQKLEKYLKPIT